MNWWVYFGYMTICFIFCILFILVCVGIFICVDNYYEDKERNKKDAGDEVLKYLEKYDDTDGVKVKYIRQIIEEYKEDKNDQ